MWSTVPSKLQAVGGVHLNQLVEALALGVSNRFRLMIEEKLQESREVRIV